MNQDIFYAKNLPKELQELIRPYTKIQPRTEADFYGASYEIAKNIGLKKPPRSFSSWSHGCILGDVKYIEQILWNKEWLFKKLVYNRRTFKFLQCSNIAGIQAVGLPITYVDSKNVKRKRNSFLFMPAHSLPHVHFNAKLNEIIDFCVRLKRAGYYVCFCVHSDCVLQGKIIPDLEKNQIDWFVGSAVDDINSLQRMRNVFEYFETVGSNTMGSHFFYSQLFGSKFCFLMPYFEYKIDFLINAPHWADKKEVLEFVLDQSSEISMKRRYPEYFLGFEKAICNQLLAQQECGLDCKVSPRELAALLGWKYYQQFFFRIFNVWDRIYKKAEKCFRLWFRE